MKKSTIIMISMAIGAWVILLSLVVYETSLGVPYNNRIITIAENDERFAEAVAPFSTLSLPYKEYSETNLWPNTFGGIIVNVSDTATTATFAAPQGLKKYLHCESAGDTLRLYIKVPPEDTIPGTAGYTPWPELRCPQPIVITTPGPLNSISSQAPYQIEICGMAADKLTVSARDGITFKGCMISEMNASSAKKDAYTLRLQGSTVSSLKADSGTTTMNISGDPASAIGSIEWTSEREKGVRLNAKGITIGSLTAPLTSLEISVDSAMVKSIASR